MCYISMEDALWLHDDSLLGVTAVEEVFKTQELDGTEQMIFAHDQYHELTRLQRCTTTDNVTPTN